MGSTNCKETPRQKMIGMMYLFLTAMLALNVSSEVLHGFTKVDESLRKSAESVGDRNSSIYNDFRNKEENNPDKVEPWRKKADEVRELSNTLFEQIQGYKLDIVKDVDGPEGNPDSIGGKSNLDGPSRVMLSRGKNSKGEELKQRLNNYRKDLIEVMEEAVKINGSKIDQSIIISLEEAFSTLPIKGNDGEEKDWAVSYFSGMPTAAAITLLTKLQNNVRDSESQVIQFLLRQIDAMDFKVNKIEAHIIPKATSIIKGGSFSAQILLAGRDTTKNPEYYVNGKKLNSGIYSVDCNETGVFKVMGEVVRYDNENNIIRHKLEEITYEVINPTATVSATKMNVLYAGVENPVSISVPGVAANDVKPEIDNGVLKVAPDGESYIVIPKDFNRLANINVMARVDGNFQQVVKYPFRVKQLPDPLPFIYYEEATVDANNNVQRIQKTTQEAAIDFRLLKYFKGIRALLPDSDFDVTYNVESFSILMKHNNGNNRTFLTEGNSFDAQTTEFLREFNGFIFISNIKATGPDGITRTLPPIATQIE